MRLFKNPFVSDPIDSPFRVHKKDAQNLIVEIGCGVGLHPIQYAQQSPDDYIIAIEKTREKYLKFAGRVEHHPDIKNIYPVHANAQHWVPQNILPNEVDKYFMLYPNPYPKEKHKNKRFMHMPFMAYIIETMKINATLELATNEKFYYQEAREVLADVWGLKLKSDSIIDSDTKARTHFEKKYLERGEVCYNLVFQKSSK